MINEDRRIVSDACQILNELSEPLRCWLPQQRWFAGKNHPIDTVVPVSATTLRRGDPQLVHAIVAVDQPGRREHYQLLLGLRLGVRSDLDHARIGPAGGWTAYDAVHDGDLADVVLDLMAANTTVGDLRFVTDPGISLTGEIRGRLLGGQQSNTSLIYGKRYILKLFRRLVNGDNPDLELHHALQSVGSQHIAPPLGAMHGTLAGEPAVLGILQQYLAAAAEGWPMATASVRDLMAQPGLSAAAAGGDFAGEAFRLGQAVADVHLDLRRSLGGRSEGPSEISKVVQGMHRRLDHACDLAPDLRRFESGLRAAYRRAGAVTSAIGVQRIHADLHLGQVLRTNHSWTLIDFEGEPGAPAQDRAAMQSPLCDVAGMLRSLDYAALQMLIGQATAALSQAAAEWTSRNRGAFCDGYADVDSDPRSNALLLRAFELDRAVYEVVYECKNRPDWAVIPLSSIASMTTGAALL